MTTEPSNDPEQPKLGKRIAKGATWMILLRFAVRSIGLVNTFILARLLVPADFGLVALAMVTITLLDMFSQFGFEMALIRDQEARREHYDTAWTIAVMKGLLMGSLLFVLAPTIADFFNDQRLTEVVRILAVIPVLQGFKNIGVVNFAKNLNFRKEFQLRILRKFAAVSVGIPLAFIWRDYWALICGLLTGRVVELILSYVLHTYRPRLSLAEWRSLFSFGKWLMVTNAVTFLCTKLDTLLIGKFLDVKTVGLYNVSYEISNLPTTELIWPISRALFPGYSKIANDRPRMVEAYLTSLSLMLLLATPLAIGIALTAEQIIVVFLTEKWLDAVPLISILALHGVMQLSFGNVRATLLALNRPNLVTYLTIFPNMVRAPLLFAGVYYYGVFGAAWALVLGAAVDLIANISVVMRLLQIRPTAILSVFWRPLIALTVMAVAVKAVDAGWPVAASAWMTAAELVAMMAVGAVAYIGMTLALWRLAGAPDGGEQQILTVLRARIAKPQAAH